MNRFADITFTMLIKGEERYIFAYYPDDQDSRSECLRTLGKFASNPDLSFSWYDAAVLSKRIRDEHLASQGQGSGGRD